jgi:hypothetical protein
MEYRKENPGHPFILDILIRLGGCLVGQKYSKIDEKWRFFR